MKCALKCTHLVKGKNVVCRALEKAYIPSLFQLVEYCRSGDYRKCPFYLRGIVCKWSGRRSERRSDDRPTTLI